MSDPSREDCEWRSNKSRLILFSSSPFSRRPRLPFPNISDVYHLHTCRLLLHTSDRPPAWKNANSPSPNNPAICLAATIRHTSPNIGRRTSSSIAPKLRPTPSSQNQPSHVAAFYDSRSKTIASRPRQSTSSRHTYLLRLSRPFSRFRTLATVASVSRSSPRETRRVYPVSIRSNGCASG